MGRKIASIILLAAANQILSLQPAQGKDADQIVDLVKSIESVLSPSNASVMYEFKNGRLDGTTAEYQVRFEMKDTDHARGYFLKPDREKGREILRLKNEIWTFVPSAGRIVRIADRDSFAGGDFSNADVLKADWSQRYNSRLIKELPDQWIVEMKASSGDATYDSIRMWIDKKTRLPVQQFFYDSQGTKLKRLRYGGVRSFGAITRPSKLVMENLITKQQSEMNVLELTVSNDIPDSRFVVDNLGK